jgi:hypothetical protein
MSLLAASALNSTLLAINHLNGVSRDLRAIIDLVIADVLPAAISSNQLIARQ